jgi:hypothetical protein
MELGAVELGATFADAHSILKIGDIPHAYLLCWLRFYKSKALALECQIVICVLDQQPCTPRSNRPNFGNRGPANRWIMCCIRAVCLTSSDASHTPPLRIFWSASLMAIISEAIA